MVIHHHTESKAKVPFHVSISFLHLQPVRECSDDSIHLNTSLLQMNTSPGLLQMAQYLCMPSSPNAKIFSFSFSTQFLHNEPSEYGCCPTISVFEDMQPMQIFSMSISPSFTLFKSKTKTPRLTDGAFGIMKKNYFFCVLA
jgi:hypothetical protein